MKIRNGFVSNSSSSSFVVFATQKDIDAALKEVVNPEIRKWIKQTFISYGQKVRFNGKEYIRKVGSWTNEDMPGWERDDFDEIGVFYVTETFFHRIGPVSIINPY